MFERCRKTAFSEEKVSVCAPSVAAVAVFQSSVLIRVFTCFAIVFWPHFWIFSSRLLSATWRATSYRPRAVLRRVLVKFNS